MGQHDLSGSVCTLRGSDRYREVVTYLLGVRVPAREVSETPRERSVASMLDLTSDSTYRPPAGRLPLVSLLNPRYGRPRKRLQLAQLLVGEHLGRGKEDGLTLPVLQTRRALVVSAESAR